MKSRQNPKFHPQKFRDEILFDAKSLGIHAGLAELAIDDVQKSVEKFILTHQVYTQSELDAVIIRHLKKYNEDLAFIYHNRDKII